MNLFLKCDQAAHLSDKQQYKEANFLERMLLKFHNFFCKFCKNYAATNEKLSKAMETSEIKILSTEQKQQIKDRLKENMG